MARRSIVVLGTISGWILFLILLFNRRGPVENLDSEKDLREIFEQRSATALKRKLTRTLPPEREDLDPPFFTPIPKQEVLERMSEMELEVLFHRYVSSPQTTCSSVERMGFVSDGGWEVCLDQRYAPDPDDCLVYSFGINYKFSFDDAMADYGCEVHSFDPSMTKRRVKINRKNVHFHLEGLGAEDGPIEMFNSTWQIYTMKSFRKRLHHTQKRRRIDMLKMDIEGAERLSLPQAFRDGSTADIPQIAFELHGNRRKPIYLALHFIESFIGLEVNECRVVKSMWFNQESLTVFDIWTEKKLEENQALSKFLIDKIVSKLITPKRTGIMSACTLP